MTLKEDVVRKINLIEVLKEEAEEEGHSIPDPPESAPHLWTEDQIKDYFATKGAKAPQSINPTSPPPQSWPPAPEADFKTWFPGLSLSRTSCQRSPPKYRILCFPNAGNAEDMYTSEGTGVRKAPSPLLEWCRANGAECLSVQYPGRGMRLREAPITTARGMAEALLPIVAFKLTESNANNNIGDNTESSSSVAVPYIVVAHSVGTWLAYEFLSLLKQKGGIPPPLRVFISAMPSPNIPFNQRPWRQQRTLEEADFIEECRGWDISEVVFSAAMWPTYQPLLRADFTLFDEYEFGGMEGGDREGEGEVFADVPKVVAFWGTRDKRVKEHHVKGWEKFLGEGVGGRFELRMIDGNHLWPLDKEAKAEWLQHIVVELEKMGQEK